MTAHFWKAAGASMLALAFAAGCGGESKPAETPVVETPGRPARSPQPQTTRHS